MSQAGLMGLLIHILIVVLSIIMAEGVEKVHNCSRVVVVRLRDDLYRSTATVAEHIAPRTAFSIALDRDCRSVQQRSYTLHLHYMGVLLSSFFA